ncbi:MAG: hypothetical protein GY851_12690, partial [bacterium]|nr:hypothetical protein [bacterium]
MRGVLSGRGRKGHTLRRHASCAAACLLLALCASVAVAQTPSGDAAGVEEGDLTLDIRTDRFVATYQDGAWVPVDVIVSNNDMDVSGFVEVRLEGATGEVTSPIYRVPAESPKGSVKRFRVYCFLEKTLAIEAMLYHKRRPVLDVPMRVELRPISGADIHSYVLDEEHEEYFFVSSALDLQSDEIRFYRDGFREDETGLLPDYYQCYESLDLIILGKMDPSTVTTRHRQLLRRFVEEGGVLVVCTGENALRFRNSWVEELAGVKVGAVKTLDEAALATHVFPTDLQEGARPGFDCVVAAIQPVEPEVRVRGTDPVLATIRPVGSGFVTVLAVDASSRALQECRGYQDMWCDLCTMRRIRGDLNYNGAYDYLVTQLPQATGVRIYPRSSVFKYLLAYFLVAVVGNWIFWSFMKRREMAWVCLVVFSFLFTGYAMVYGTAGRAKSTELEQLEVARVPLNSTTARLHSYVGLLTARTARYAFKLAHETGLIAEGSRSSQPWLYNRQRTGFGSGIRPFTFTQGSEPRVDGFGVGASEMRVVQLEADVSVAGGVEGTLTLDSEGLRGKLINATGLRLREPFLLLDGRQIKLEPNQNEWELNLGQRQLLEGIARRRQDMNTAMVRSRNYRGDNRVMGSHELRKPFLASLLASNSSLGNTSDSFGPFLCGWVDGPRFGSIELGEPAQERISETLAVCDVRIERGSGAPKRLEQLAVKINGKPWSPAGYNQGNWAANAHQLAPNQSAIVQIEIPWRFLEQEPDEMLLELWWNAEGGEMVFVPAGKDAEWSRKRIVTTGNERDEYGRQVTKTLYKFPDWQACIDEKTGALNGVIAVKRPGGGGRRGQAWGSFVIMPKLRVGS